MQIKDKTVLITGGAGFIGTSLAKKLVDDNKIILFDNLWRNALKNTELPNHPNLEFVKGDVVNFGEVRDILAQYRPQVILHMAAIAGIDTVIKSPTNTLRVNIIGTYNLLEALKENPGRVERFVDFSTSEVLGVRSFKSPETFATNLQPVGPARWVYAASKLTSEHLTHAYFKEFNLPAVIVRPFNIYGPGQVGEGAVHVFIKRALENLDLEIHGDGDQIRSWCYIDDMLKGVLLCLEKDQAQGQIFNIGNPRGTVTITSLAEKIVQLSGSKSKIVHVPKNYVDVELRIPNIEKAREVLDYQPEVDLNEGLLLTIDWYRKGIHS